jgi:hypothetical protein
MSIEQRIAKLGIAKPLRETEDMIASVYLILGGRLSLERVAVCVNDIEGFMSRR